MYAKNIRKHAEAELKLHNNDNVLKLLNYK